MIDSAGVGRLDRSMSGKKDEGCGHGTGAVTDELAPMRRWEGGMSSTGYASGPTHVDRADFREGDDAAETEPAAEASEGEAAAPVVEEDDAAG